MAEEHVLAEVRRDIGKLSAELGRGMSAANILIEQVKGSIADISRRLDQKVRDDHHGDVKLAEDLGKISAKIEAMEKDLSQLSSLPAMLARLEAGHDHLRGDVTGKHDVEKTKVEVADKKEDREVEKAKIAADERRAKLQFWGAIAAVALPGIISMLWQIFGMHGDPPTTPAVHPELPSVAAPPHHESGS